MTYYKKYDKKYKNEHKDHIKQYKHQYQKQINEVKKKFIQSYKKTHPCELCGEVDIACLVFHHRDSKLKQFSVSSYHGKRINSIMSEIDKCQVLCANCHMKLHFYK